MPIEDLQVDGKPFDRLTFYTRKMTDALEQIIAEDRRDLAIQGVTDPEQLAEKVPDVKAIVFLSDPDRSGIQMLGYKDTSEGMADLLVHMKAIFTSMGKGFGVMTDQGVMLMDET